MKQIYRIQFPGAPQLDFTIGAEHRDYGLVLSIVESTEVLTYDQDNHAIRYQRVVKVIFKDQEIVFNANNPLMVVYRKDEK